MAPPQGLSTPIALKVKIQTKKKESIVGHEISVFSYRFAQYFASVKLHTFPIVPTYSQAPRPLKRSKNFNLLFIFFATFTLLVYFVGPIRAMVTRPVQGP